MNNKQFIKTILEIEKEFDVNSLKVNGITVWPLVRLYLIDILLNKRNLKAPIIQNPKGLKEKYLQNQSKWKKYKKDFVANDTIDFLLFFHANWPHYIDIDGKKHNRFLDSFYYLFKNKYCIKYLTINGVDSYNNKLYINITDAIKEFARIEALYDFWNHRFKIDNIDNFIDFMKIKNIDIDKSYLLYMANILMNNIYYFKEILSILQPKNIVTYVYYTIDTMALNVASNLLNIETIDLEHGIENKYHYMYSNWSKIPDNGYVLLPKNFFVWSKRNKLYRKWVENSKYHKVFIAGNIFFIFLKNSNILGKKDIKIKKYYPPHKNNILISLQIYKYYSKDIIKLINFFKKNKKIIWHFKHHPIFEKDQFPKKIKRYINNKNIEYKFTDTKSIYSLARYIDINITGFSTTSIELKELNNISTIFTENLQKIKHRNFYNITNLYQLKKKFKYLLKKKNNQRTKKIFYYEKKEFEKHLKTFSKKKETF